MPMWIRTSDDWTAATFSLDDGGGAHVFTPAATENSAKDALDALVTFVAANFPGETMASTWAEDATTGGSSVTMTFSTAVSITSNAAAQTLSGLPAVSAFALTHTSVWAGTWHPQQGVSLTNWHRHLKGGGNASLTGAVRPGIPGTSLHRPDVQALGNDVQTGRIADIMRDIAVPSQAWIYQEPLSTWRLVSLGKIQRSRVEGNRWHFRIQVAG